jgi:hypothetical protein
LIGLFFSYRVLIIENLLRKVTPFLLKKCK